MDRSIRTYDDVMALLDTMVGPEADRSTPAAADWWDAFYQDRDAPVPFFAAKPDRSLADHAAAGLLAPGRALDPGCGPGRNALYLASLGYDTDAVDLSREALAWAEERGRAARAPPSASTTATPSPSPARRPPPGPVRPRPRLGLLPPPASPPQGRLPRPARPRPRPGVPLLPQLLRGRRHGLGGGRRRRLPGRGARGGLAYTAESLRHIFGDLTEVDLRRMSQEPPASPYFGEPFLWTALFRRPPAP